jgi:DNA primase
MLYTADTAHAKLNSSELKAGIDLRIVAEQLFGPAVRRSSRYVQYRAPDRHERTPSLTVWADGFKDFGDATHHGDVFTFLEVYKGMSFREALDYLAREGGSAPAAPFYCQLSQKRSVTASPLPDANWQRTVTHLLTRCQATLDKCPEAQQYLMKQGYTKTTIASRGLGLNLAWSKIAWHKPDGKQAWLPPGIVFPWFHDGNLVGLKVRLPYHKNGQPDALARLLGCKPQKAKYMQVAGSSLGSAWYGDLADTTRPVIFCEGEKDCDNLYQRIGDRTSIVTLGSASGRVPPALIQRLRPVPWIAVVPDNDEAGTQSALRIQQQLKTALGNKAIVILGCVPPDYKDISDWILDDGEKQLDQWFRQLERQAGYARRRAAWNPAQNTYFPQGVPDVLREALLGLHRLGATTGQRYIQDHANAALVLELYHEAILQACLTADAPLTVADLRTVALSLERNCTESAIRRGLEQLCALGFLELIANLPPGEHNFSGQREGGRSAKNSSPRRGRPTLRYRIVPLAEALATFLARVEVRIREALYADRLPNHVQPEWFGGLLAADEAAAVAETLEIASQELYAMHQVELRRVEREIGKQLAVYRRNLALAALSDAGSTPLAPSVPYSSGRELRDAYYRALIEEAGPAGRQITRASAAAQLGVDRKTLQHIRRRVGVVAEPRFERFELDDAEYVHRRANWLAPWAADRVYGRYLESSSGQCIRLDMQNPARNDDWVAGQLARGCRVWLKVQVASRERFATPQEREILHRPVMWCCGRRRQDGTGRRRPLRIDPLTGECLPVPPPAAVCPPAHTRAYVYDQLWLRRALWLASAETGGLQKVLIHLGLVSSIAYWDIGRYPCPS